MIQQREFKFRAWYKAVMVDLHKITPLALDSGMEGKDGVYIPFGEDLIVMQYTGLKDKKGKDIYEGDIVIKYGSLSMEGKEVERGEVKWFNSESCFSLDKKGCWCLGIYTKGKVNYLEVIGNIYENPELLTP